MRAFLTRPQTVPLRRVIFQVHLWFGVATGLYLLVISMTGAALVFRIDMQRAGFPHLFTPTSGGPAADLADVLESVQQAYPGHRISGIDTPTTARPTALAYVTRGREFLTVLVDPATGRVLGELPDRSFVRTLQDLHFDLLGGRRGRVVNGVGACCLLAMCVTGLVIWWPGIANWRRAMTVDVRRGWKRVTFDLHGAVGIWTFAFLTMWALTGIHFAFPSQFRATVNRFSAVTTLRVPSSDVAMRGRQPQPEWSALIGTARARMPGRHTARVVFPATETAPFHVLFAREVPTPLGPDALESVYLDQYTGALLQAQAPGPRSAGDIVLAWVGPLHVGTVAGRVGKAAWLAIGLMPSVLFVTGFVMWWNRVLRERWARLTARPPAGSIEAGSGPTSDSGRRDRAI